MAKRILKSVKKYFSEFLYVRFPNRISIKSFSLVDGYQVDSFTMHSDLKVIIVPEFNTESSHFAAASAVYLAPLDRRPMVGLYYLNFASLKASINNEWMFFNIFAHEFTHILGFSNSLFKDFYFDGGARPLSKTVGKIKLAGVDYNAIIMPEVVKFA